MAQLPQFFGSLVVLTQAPLQQATLHALPATHWPAPLHVCGVRLLHSTCPGAQTPAHAPLTHVWFAHAVALPHSPLEVHTSTALPEQREVPAAQTPASTVPPSDPEELDALPELLPDPDDPEELDALPELLPDPEPLPDPEEPVSASVPLDELDGTNDDASSAPPWPLASAPPLLACEALLAPFVRSFVSMSKEQPAAPTNPSATPPRRARRWSRPMPATV